MVESNRLLKAIILDPNRVCRASSNNGDVDDRAVAASQTAVILFYLVRARPRLFFFSVQFGAFYL